MYRLLRIVVGGIFMLLGFIGLFLPVLQGFLFLGIGIALLYRDLPFLPRFMARLRMRYPVFERASERFKETFPGRS